MHMKQKIMKKALLFQLVFLFDLFLCVILFSNILDCIFVMCEFVLFHFLGTRFQSVGGSL